VRGKNILWLTLIAILLCVTVADLGYAQTPATISLDPIYVTGYLPGDLFSVNLMITGAENVYAWGAELKFAPYVNLLAVNSMAEGSFLQAGGETYFASYVDAFKGLVKIGATLVGGGSGVGGDGFLATITFQVIEAGECPLTLFNTELLDPDLFSLDHTVATFYVDDRGPYTGYYYGATSLFVMGKVDTRVIRLSKQSYQTFNSKAYNNATVPLYTRVNYYMTRLEDGMVRNLWTDPAQMDVGIDGYGGEKPGWTTVGKSPYLTGVGDGSYVETILNYSTIGDFTFSNITVKPDKSYGVLLNVYGWDLTGPWVIPGYGTTYMNNKILAWIWDGTLWQKLTLWPYSYGLPARFGWMVSDISHILQTADQINNAKIYFELEPGVGPPNKGVRVDYVDLRVYEWGSPLAPGENRDMNPVVWNLTPADVGTWVVEISAYYRYYLPPPNPALPAIWNKALKVKTLTFRVLP
jgi:hypothetical protein